MFEKIPFAVVLGSGLVLPSINLKNTEVLKTEPNSLHTIRIIKAYFKGYPFVIITGRKHFYEGYSVNEITSYIRYLKGLGVKYLLLTNAAGGVNLNYNVCDLMLIKSFISFNFLKIKPGNRVSIDSKFGNLLTKAASINKIKIHQGIYGYLIGPAYETKAEIHFLKKYYVDAVGMSTVPEIIAAQRLGIKTAAVSVITNKLSETKPVKASHNEVINASKKAASQLLPIISTLIQELNK